jgi:hypothetical protein
MASPKTVGQFYVETTSQAAKSAASAQDAAARYLDELAAIGVAYFETWSSVQKESLQTAFQLQNSLVQASQTATEAATRSSLAAFDEWVKVVVAGQEAVSRLTAAVASMTEGPARAKKG